MGNVKTDKRRCWGLRSTALYAVPGRRRPKLKMEFCSIRVPVPADLTSLRETNESKAGMTDGATRHPKLIIDHQFVTTITFLTYTHGVSR